MPKFWNFGKVNPHLTFKKKMKKIRYIAISCLIILLALSCGGETPSPNPPDPPKPPVKPAPDATVLSAPANNSACLKGSTESETTAILSFSWNKAANADSYVLEIKNLQTDQKTSYTTTALTYSATLPIGTHYSWSVTAINSIGKTAGSVWKFYLSGVAASNYAPFPAELTAPTYGAIINAKGASTAKITLQWNGSDIDNDIASYTVYLDNTNASTQIVASQTQNTSEQTLQSDKTYYWKVVTIDKAGNKSTSAVSAFQIK
mgnify:CR=1 FL=1